MNDTKYTHTFVYPKHDPLTLDMSSYKISEQIKEALFLGICQIAGAYNRKSAFNYWFGIRKLISYLEENLHLSSTTLPDNVFDNYMASINSKNLKSISKNLYVNQAYRLLRWIKKTRPDVASPLLNLYKKRFTEDTSYRHKLFLTEEQLKEILSACEIEMVNHWNDFILGRRILDGDVRSPEEELLKDTLERLFKLGDGLFPTQRTVTLEKPRSVNLRKVSLLGGLSKLKRYCFLTTDTFLPFYLSITAQTAGNPEAILDINRKCIVDHEIFEHSKFIVWEKSRSYKEQKREFDTRNRFSPPNLVQMLLKMTDALHMRAKPIYSNRLFLHQRYEIPTVFSKQTLHNSLGKFIKSHQLTNFNPSDLRASSADLHHQKGGINEAKIVVNHKDIRTTQLYLNKPRVQEGHDQLIHKFQGLLLNTILHRENSASNRTEVNSDEEEKKATTFGFDCKNPFEGIAKGSKKGEVCNLFRLCAGCPGAIVILDDVQIAARLLQTENYLNYWKKRAQGEGWAKRFNVLYLDSLVILDEDLIPKIPAAILKQAQDIVPTLPQLPDLE